MFSFNSEQMSSNVTDTFLERVQPVLMAEGILSFILNSMFLFVLARNKDLVKRQRITYHVANLALADTLVGLSLFMTTTIRRGIVHVHIDCLDWLQRINQGAIFLSFMAVFFMAFERIVVIKWPFTWKEILTLKRVFAAIFITWITAVILVIIPFPNTYRKLTKSNLFVIIFFFCGIAIFIANIVIACLLQYQKRKLAAIVGTQQTTNCSKEKALKLVITINVILAVTCVPFGVTYLTISICVLSRLYCNFNVLFIFRDVTQYLYVLGYANFIVNPIIYIWRTNTYRKAFYSMFKKNINTT